MQVTSLKIVSTAGANRAPRSGYAKFDDGKAYDWYVVPGGEISFAAYRRTHGGSGTVFASFASPKRAAAIRAALDI